MTNLLNDYISNKPLNKPLEQNSGSFSAVKPMEHKGELLPSKIIGSPVEYFKDLKKDIVAIGKGSKGQANDHELGRVNDLAMKIGSIALASYLFVKNPLKLNKTMEFVGFGTFFASMALWPKLAIQAPLKARTGVDIHQKYIDSQDRKKMLFQDPQYNLTDLYSRDDLDKMGKKLKVNENLPDRDSFIKKRASKTAVQGNTLWMMTAGIASPVMSALACNRLEKPIKNVLEKIDMSSSESALVKNQGMFSKIKQFFSDKSLERFLSKNSDEVMNKETVSKITSKLGNKLGSPVLKKSVEEELLALKNNVTIDETFVKNALGTGMSERISAFSAEQKTLLDQAIKNGSLEQISSVIAAAVEKSPAKRKQMAKGCNKILENAKNQAEQPLVSQVRDSIVKLNNNITNFVSGKNVIDKYVNSRVGDKSGTYIANQWDRVCSRIFKSLKLTERELKAVSEGNMDIISKKLSELAVNEPEFDKAVEKLMKQINNYENTTGNQFVSNVQFFSSRVCNEAASGMKNDGFSTLARNIASAGENSNIENVINVNAKERISGAKSSFYRLLQSLDLSKRLKNKEEFIKCITKELEKDGPVDSQTIEKLTKACEDIINKATTTSYVEKFKGFGFDLSEKEYKTVMKVLFEDSSGSAISESLTRTVGAEKAEQMMAGFKEYKKEFMEKVVNWKNDMTPELSRCVAGDATYSQNAVERANLVGKPVKGFFQDAAKQIYNSRKWLKIFGGTMAALTIVTLAAGLFIGRKDKVEKEAEEKSKAVGND